jgi:hypothetical protein
MTRQSVLLPALLSLFIGACGARPPAPEVARTNPSSQEEYAARSPAQPAPESPAMAAPPADAAGREKRAEAESGSYDYDYQDRSQRRPGLATQWGEERDSRVHEVSFERQRSTPAGVVSVHYDDESGVELATGRSADDAFPRTFPVQGGAITVSVTDDDGDPLPTMHVNGRDFVIGEHGDRYQLEIKNFTAGRFEIVASVDGLDVLDGQDGGYEKRGYLVSPWSTLTIEGFRDSYDTVRAFRFGEVDSSYAAQRGKARNIGVIGVAVFEERGFRWGFDDDEVTRRRNADPFPTRFAPAP